jgi:hypothetical protein
MSRLLRFLLGSKRRLVLTGVPLAVILGAAAAIAYFSTVATGKATATLGTLSAPAAPTATAGAGTVALSWSTVSPPTGSDTVSYYVRRDGANPGGNCPTSASPSTATSCTDSGLSAGTYHYTVTAVWRSWSATSSSTAVTLASGAFDHFSLTATTSTPIAGQADNLAITAKDVAGNTVTTYGGDQTLTFSGAGTIGSYQPTVTSKTGIAVAFGTAETISFTNGVASVSGSSNGVMTLYKAETATVTVSDGTHTGSLVVLTGSASAVAFTVSTPSSATAGSAFTVTLTAKDTYGNTATGYTGSHTIDFSGPHSSPGGTGPSYPSSVSFTTGAGSASVTLYDAETTTLTASDHASPSITGTSGSIAVGPGSGASLSLSAASTTPTAGAADNLTITAKDTWLNTATGYAGSKNLTFGGASSIGANNPTVTNSSGTAIAFGSTTAVTFTSGVASVSGSSNGVLTLYKAQTASVTVSDGSLSNGAGLSFTVSAAAVANIAATSGAGQSANVGTAFTSPLAATVTDTYGNAKSGVSVTFSAPASGASATFASGGNCTSNPQTYQCVATTNGSGVATSSAFTANATQGAYNISAAAAGGSNPSVNFGATNLGLLHVSSFVTGSTSGLTTWTGTITVTVKDASGNVVSGVAVSGSWSPTSAASPSGCTTNSSGQCTITPSAGAFPSGQLTETWTVSALTLTGYAYASASNVESSITLSQNCAAGTVCETNLTSTSAFTDTTANTGSSTASLSAGNTPPSGSTVLILITRDGSQSGDTVSSVGGSAISGATLVTSNTNNLSSAAGAFTNLWVYRATGTGTGSSPAVTVTFGKSDNIATLVQVLVLSGENSAGAVAQSNNTNKCTTSCTSTTATVTLTGSLSSGSKEIVLVGEAKASTITMASTSWTTKLFWANASGTTGANDGSFFGTTASSGTVTLGTASLWGAIALEVAKAT